MRILGLGDADRDAALATALGRGDPFADADARAIAERVREILERVRQEGDDALRALTREHDRRELEPIELDAAAWDGACARVRADVREALALAAHRIEAFHAPQRSQGYVLDEGGARLELRTTPLRRVGVYAPGGSARYPSSVLMAAIPARVAGVAEICMTTPGPSDETLLAARLAGVHRVFLIGGAQAIGAFAFGTATVPRVDKIVGPGNAWVAEAKRQVFGVVDIDQVAGPSEILVLADDGAIPAWVAADLLSQAEHDPAARALLVTPSPALARAVATEVDSQLARLPRREIAARAIDAHGLIVVTRDLDDAVALARRYAPEHLSIQTRDPEALAARIDTAGAIFVGAHTPEAAGDYLAGPNHVLPTAGAARYGSPLGVYDFEKRTSLLRYSPAALAAHGPAIELLADVEGLVAHGRAVAVRTRGDGGKR